MIWRVMISVSRKHDISGFLSSQEWQLSNFCHTREGGYPVFVFRFWLQTYDLWLITKINIDEYHVISLWPKTLDRFFPALRDRREGCWVTSKHRSLVFVMPLDSSNAEGILFFLPQSIGTYPKWLLKKLLVVKVLLLKEVDFDDSRKTEDDLLHISVFCPSIW